MSRVSILPAVLLLLGGLLTSSCRAPEADPKASGLPFYSAPERTFHPDSTTRSEALALLRILDVETFRAAYDRLSAYRYTARTRTEQLQASGAVVAFKAYTIRHDRRHHEVLARKDSGTFDFGFLGRFITPDHVIDTATTSLGVLVLPDDPAYRSPRYRSAYAYTLHTDTSRWNRPMRVLTVHARPNAGSSLVIRHARFYVEPSTQALVGLDLLRVADTWLFDEASRFTLYLRQAPDSLWVPHTVHLRTRLQLPLRPAWRFRSTTRYLDYAPLHLRPTTIHKGL